MSVKSEKHDINCTCHDCWKAHKEQGSIMPSSQQNDHSEQDLGMVSSQPENREQPIMSNTKQQIEEMLNKVSEYNKLSGKGHGDLKDNCYICGISPSGLIDAIDRLVTEAKQDVLKELVEWYEYALSVDDTSFDWYRAVKALMVSKDHKKPFSQLSNKENI